MNNSELVSLIYALMEGPWRRLVREAGAARRLMGSPEPRGGCGPRCRDWAKRWRCHPRNVFRTRLVFPQSAQAFSRELKCVIGLNVLRQDSVEPPPRAAKTELPITTLPDAEGPPPALPGDSHTAWSGRHLSFSRRGAGQKIYLDGQAT